MKKPQEAIVVKKTGGEHSQQSGVSTVESKQQEPLDLDGQPLNRALNAKRNKNKAASALMGILAGITADKSLNKIEVTFLRTWLENQPKAELKGDFLDIYDAIEAVLKDGVIDAEERDDLLQLLNDCIEFDEHVYLSDVLVNKLIGFMKGIAADGKIERLEFDRLVSEVSNSPTIANSFPCNVIQKRLIAILRDNQVTEKELQDLNSFINEITGTRFTVDGDAIGGATTLFDDALPKDLAGLHICLTGKFLSGTRNEMNQVAMSMGCIPQDKVSSETELVVIGTLSSRDWIHTSTGRKIELAMKYRKKKPILISTERTWLGLK